MDPGSRRGLLGRLLGPVSGFLIRADGVIVTNFHVVEDATSIRAVFLPPDRRTFEGRVIGSSSEHDLAVLKVDGTDLPTLPLGESSSLQLGQQVVAIGYALALEGGPTVTAAYLGVVTTTVDPGLAFQLGLPVESGPLVQGVTGPAQEAGVQVGDVIVAFEGQEVLGSEEPGEAILARNPEDQVEIGVVHPDGSEDTVTAVLAVRPLPTP